MHLRLIFLSLAALIAVPIEHAWAGEFTYNAAQCKMIEKSWLLNAPVYFTVPVSARLPLPQSIDTRLGEQLIDFRHPDGAGSSANPGLRIILTKREGFGAEAARTGLIQSGDILLWFNPRWSGGGAYPNIQMGVEHAGMAYLHNGEIRNIDNPLGDPRYYSRDSKFGGVYYSAGSGDMWHIIRPRGLTDAERTVIAKWADRFVSIVGPNFYGKGDKNYFAFAPTYNVPLYRPGQPLAFVQRLGQIGLMSPSSPPPTRSSTEPPTDLLQMFCAEFVWSLLALRDCDPDTSAADINGNSVPACIKPIMSPLPVTGHYFFQRSSKQDIGLADGPMVAIDALKRPLAQTDAMIDTIFVANPNVVKSMAPSHRQLAEQLQSKFALLKPYYKAVSAGGVEDFFASIEAIGLREAVPDNYSPSSFLIDTLTPPDSDKRSMDYVATIKFTD